jgi:peroxiredoxin
MKLLAGILLLATSALGQSVNDSAIDGIWEGVATVRGQQVPVRLQITGPAPTLKAVLLNGPEQSAASSATLSDDHLVVTFNYYARTLDAKLENGQLTGTFGLVSAKAATPRYPVVLHHATAAAPPVSGPNVRGDWEISVSSSKGESAWLLRVQPVGKAYGVHAVIQRIDGDTGSLYGTWDGSAYKVGRFTAAGPALYSLTPKSDGTLLVSNLLAAPELKAQSIDLVARRPADARKEKLAAPTSSTEQTRMKDPSAPFAFRFPDLTGKLISNTDPQFQGKVVIVAIGGSWCPNCHDEAPFLESLYKQYHSKGLEIVSLSFEEDDQLQDPARLRAFIARYGITYPVLVAGTPDQLQEKIPQADHLNCWPTSFILGRDGRVKEVHAGFAGPANPEGHKELEHEVTALVTSLLAQPAGTQNALR